MTDCPSRDKSAHTCCFAELLLHGGAWNDLPSYFYLPRGNAKEVGSYPADSPQSWRAARKDQ